MTIRPGSLGAVVTDLLTSLDATLEDKLARALWRLVKLKGARAGALVFRPRRQPPVAAIVGETRALRDWLPAATTDAPPRGPRIRALAGRGPRRDTTMRLEGTLLDRLAQTGAPLRVDDVQAAGVPVSSREAFGSRGYRAAALVPLASRGRVFGAVTVTAREPGAFDARDLQV